MKQFQSILAALALSSLGLVACSGGQNSADSQGTKSDTGVKNDTPANPRDTASKVNGRPRSVETGTSGGSSNKGDGKDSIHVPAKVNR